jgi:hypothetical protein
LRSNATSFAGIGVVSRPRGCNAVATRIRTTNLRRQRLKKCGKDECLTAFREPWSFSFVAAPRPFQRLKPAVALQHILLLFRQPERTAQIILPLRSFQEAFGFEPFEVGQVA